MSRRHLLGSIPFILVLVFLVAIFITGLIRAINRDLARNEEKQCLARWAHSNLEATYSPVAGCLILTGNGFVPEANVRID